MNRLLDFVKELSFVRIGGTAEEKKAAEMIVREVNQAAAEAGRSDIQGTSCRFPFLPLT